jgi:hypothetical protein
MHKDTGVIDFSLFQIRADSARVELGDGFSALENQKQDKDL